MLAIGNRNISNLMVGQRQAIAAYLGKALVWRKIVPIPYDAEVEYLGCSGRQYIQTGLQVVNYIGYQLEIKFRFTSQVHTESWCMGYWNTDPEWRIYLAGHYYEYLRCGAGPDNAIYHCSKEFDTNWHVAELKLDGAYFDGERGADCDLYALPQPTTSSIWLCRSSHADGGTPRQIAYCKFWTVGGQLVRDYIPVRKDGIGYWYDKVSGQLFGNDGTDAFTIGPDK